MFILVQIQNLQHCIHTKTVWLLTYTHRYYITDIIYIFVVRIFLWSKNFKNQFNLFSLVSDYGLDSDTKKNQNSTGLKIIYTWNYKNSKIKRQRHGAGCQCPLLSEFDYHVVFNNYRFFCLISILTFSLKSSL